jgi:hypothetical protein
VVESGVCGVGNEWSETWNCVPGIYVHYQCTHETGGAKQSAKSVCELSTGAVNNTIRGLI